MAHQHVKRPSNVIEVAGQGPNKSFQQSRSSV